MARALTIHRGAANHTWKGGRCKDSFGYVKLRRPEHPNAVGGYVFEHRLVMEEHLGRLLTRQEIVHHINGDRADNRVENLEVMTQSEHFRRHSHWARLSFALAREIRQRYAGGGWTYVSLAQAYGVKKGTIGDILNNRSYVEA